MVLFHLCFVNDLREHLGPVICNLCPSECQDSREVPQGRRKSVRLGSSSCLNWSSSWLISFVGGGRDHIRLRWKLISSVFLLKEDKRKERGERPREGRKEGGGKWRREEKGDEKEEGKGEEWASCAHLNCEL